MRSFVVCIVLAGSALVSASWAPGVPQDTPEVAAAKAAHLSAVARAQSGGHAGAWNGGWNGAWNGAGNGAWNGAGNGAWNGAQDDGQWKDDTHLYNYAGNWNDDGQWRGNGNNGAWNSWNSVDDGQWRDDTRAAYGDDDGQWRGDNGAAWGGQGVWTGHGAGAWNQGTLINGETPEVAAARAAHLAAHAAAASHGHGRWRRSLVAVNPNSLPVPLDTAIVANAKNAQLIQQNTEGTRNILGGGIPLALPADTHEVAIGKQAHAIAHANQRALTSHGVVAAAPAVVAAAPALSVAAPAVAVAAPAVSWAARSVVAPALSWGSPAVAAPALSWGSPAVAAPALSWAAPIAVARAVPSSALRYDTQLVAPGIIGARPVPVAAHGVHY